LGAGSPTTYRGDGYEFVELRAYVPGDDVRRIDWAATARSGDLQTRVVLEDVALTLAAIVDASPSMGVGRLRPLFDAAREATEAWFGAATGEDRCMRIAADGVTPRALQRRAHRAVAAVSLGSAPFDIARTLRAARAALPRGTALLAIGDWYDLHPEFDRDVAELGARFDCTALVARDPWYGAFVGARERAAYRSAVERRESDLISRFSRANWRTGVLHEADGTGSLLAAFGLHA